MFKRNEINAGDLVEVQLAGAYQRYSVPLVRTFLTEGAPRQASKLQGTAVECLKSIEENVKPGVRIGDVARSVADLINKRDLVDHWPRTRFGHSIGVGMPPSWTEEWLELREDNDREFETGMTFHSVMSLRIPGQFGYSVGDSWVVTDSGIEVLTKLPYLM